MGIYLGDQALAISTAVNIVQDLTPANVSTDKVTSSQCVKDAIGDIKNDIASIGPTPDGGAAGQVLSKISGADHDFAWKNTVLPADEAAKLKVWTGNEAEYTAIVTKDPETLYNVTDEVNIATVAPSDAGYIGEFRDIYLQNPPSGWAVRNGALITCAATNNYAMLIEFLKANPWITKTEEEWQDLSSAAPFEGIGGVPFFVLDETTNTIRLPDTRGMYSAGSGWNNTVVGDVVGDAIRNIKGALSSAGKHPVLWTACVPSGAFETVVKTLHSPYSDSTNAGQIDSIQFDASNVVPTAPRNQPASYYTLPCVYIGTDLI